MPLHKEKAMDDRAVPQPTVSAGLSLLSDDELERLRTRVVEAVRVGTPVQRMAMSGQLEAIDIETDRRLSAPAA